MSSSSLRRYRLLVAFALWLIPTSVLADTATLAWDPSTDAAGYTVKWGTALGTYPNTANAGNNTTFVIPGLTAGGTYWVVVQAYNATGVSDDSVPLQFTVPLACTFSVSPTSVNAPAAGTNGSLTVMTQTGCGWTANSATPFLTLQTTTGMGPGNVAFTVAANTSTTARTATATVAGAAVTVSQAGAACTFAISPATAAVGDTATSGTVTVTTQAGCAWSATSVSPSLTFTNGTGRTGSGTVTYNVAANTTTTGRTLSGTIATQTFSVTQAGQPAACTYSISPGNGNAPAAGTTGTITVTTQAGCAWSAANAGFLTFTNGTGRSGPGTVTYVVPENTGAFRTTIATVATKSFTLWQAAQSCTYSITPTTVNAGAAATSGSVTVTTQTGCAWNAQSMSATLTFQNGTGRTGPGSVGYTLAENTEALSRNATGLIANTNFTISQAGTAPAVPPAPSPWSSDFDGDGKNDILVQHATSGIVEAWFLNNATVKGTQTLSDTLDTNWMLAGRGDFNADGKTDLVWQHKSDGRVVLWYMDGTTRTQAVTPSIGQIGDPQWKIVGVGDFNADGSPDLVWQHSGDGALAAWLMSGSTVNSTQAFVPDRANSVLWKVVGVGEFNGDGKSDLLWRHTGTGEMGVWLMNGLTRIIHSPLSPMFVADQRWQVGGVTDTNGDGKPDLIWHHTDGTIMIWHMNGTSRVTYPTVTPGLPAGWSIVGPK